MRSSVHLNRNVEYQCCHSPVLILILVSIKTSDKTWNRQACRDYYVHDMHMAGLHTSDRLLLEAVREVNLFYHAGIRTGDPRSDRRQVQDFTTELRVQAWYDLDLKMKIMLVLMVRLLIYLQILNLAVMGAI